MTQHTLARADVWRIATQGTYQLFTVADAAALTDTDAQLRAKIDALLAACKAALEVIIDATNVICGEWSSCPTEYEATVQELRAAISKAEGNCCPTCGGKGYYMDGPTDHPEQIQCGDCYGTGTIAKAEAQP